MSVDQAALAREPARNATGERPAGDRGHPACAEGWRSLVLQVEYGPLTTVWNRFSRWSHRGFWLKLLDALVEAGGGKEYRHKQHLREGALGCIWLKR